MIICFNDDAKLASINYLAPFRTLNANGKPNNLG